MKRSQIKVGDHLAWKRQGYFTHAREVIVLSDRPWIDHRYFKAQSVDSVTVEGVEYKIPSTFRYAEEFDGKSGVLVVEVARGSWPQQVRVVQLPTLIGTWEQEVEDAARRARLEEERYAKIEALEKAIADQAKELSELLGFEITPTSEGEAQALISFDRLQQLAARVASEGQVIIELGGGVIHGAQRVVCGNRFDFPVTVHEYDLDGSEEDDGYTVQTDENGYEFIEYTVNRPKGVA